LVYAAFYESLVVFVPEDVGNFTACFGHSNRADF
jgi:hypothetical protein